MNEHNSSTTTSPTITWGKPKPIKVLQVRLGKDGLLGNGNSCSMLFGDLKAELNGETGGLHAVAVTTVQLPVQADLQKGFVGFLIRVRGMASVTAGSRVSLMVSVNARAEVARLNLVEGTAADIQILHEQFVVEQRGPAETNPNVPPLQPLLVTLTLVAQRASMSDWAILQVDSVDLLACFG